MGSNADRLKAGGFSSKHNFSPQSEKMEEYTLFLYKNVVFPAQAEYSYFSVDLKYS